MGLFSIFKHETRLREVEDKADQLERAFQALELEWNAVYDNVRRLSAKIAKRDQRAEAEQPSADPQAPVAGDISERIRAARRAPR